MNNLWIGVGMFLVFIIVLLKFKQKYFSVITDVQPQGETEAKPAINPATGMPPLAADPGSRRKGISRVNSSLYLPRSRKSMEASPVSPEKTSSSGKNNGKSASPEI